MQPAKFTGLIATVVLLAARGASATDELPPLTLDLDGVSAVACVKISKASAVSGAFLLSSTGAPERDRRLLQWIRQLHWPPASPGEKLRDVWFPMPVAIGEGVEAPEGPQSCSPPLGHTLQPQT